MRGVTSTYSVAARLGYAYLNATTEVHVHKGIVFGQFFKNAERTGPCIFVGYNTRAKRYEYYRDKLPDEKAK
jgi:hypothetical protein